MESTRPIRALMRGLEALTVLNQRGDATVSEIARAIRLPRTTVYRILETLCESGFVFRDAADERYHLTALVRGLSAGFNDADWVALIARPLLHELGEQLAWPVHLTTLAGSRLRVRAVVEQPLAHALDRLAAGAPLSLLGSADGRTYLACCDAPERDALFAALARSGREAEQAQRARAELQRAFGEIRAQGYGLMSRSGRRADEINVSVPVRGNDRMLAVLSARFAAAALPTKSALERFLPKLQQCAANISDTFSAQQAGARHASAPQAAVQGV